MFLNRSRSFHSILFCHASTLAQRDPELVERVTGGGAHVTDPTATA